MVPHFLLILQIWDQATQGKLNRWQSFHKRTVAGNLISSPLAPLLNMSIAERKHGGVYCILFVSGKYSELVKPKKKTLWPSQRAYSKMAMSLYRKKKGLKLVFESKQMRSAASKELRQGSADQILLPACSVWKEGQSPCSPLNFSQIGKTSSKMAVRLLQKLGMCTCFTLLYICIYNYSQTKSLTEFKQKMPTLNLMCILDLGINPAYLILSVL